MGLPGWDEFNAKTLRYISENAEVEHTLLTPFRWLIGFGKTIIYVLLATSWFLFTVVGWTVNVGEYSLENRREAVCDARAYVHICDPYEFDATHPHTDYIWDFSRKVTTDGSNFPDVRLLVDSSLVTYGVGNYLPEEADPTPKPWISFGDREFFMRGTDVFRRKSRQMDAALVAASLADDALIFAIAEAKHVGQACVRLPDAPKIELRKGVMPADAISSKDAVTWGLCLKQECAADGSDLSYALFWADILWTKPALGKHQQNAVNALQQMDTLAFWLREAHANGMYNDALIQKEFQDDHQIIQRTLRSRQT